MADRRVAVIGAGVSGLACAARLAAAGARVTVFEKSRGVGGRMAVRRDEAGFAFDHGAQYFTARDPRFVAVVEAWQRLGRAAAWPGRFGVVRQGVVVAEESSPQRFVGVPGMNAVCKQLAEPLETRLGARVAPPLRDADAWRLRDEHGLELGVFDVVIVSAPSEQAAELLAAAPALAARARSAVMVPCWSLMLAGEGRLESAFDGLFVHDGPLAWCCRDASKPGRSGEHDTWVLHATPEWSRERLEADPGQVAAALLAAFRLAVGAAPRGPRHVAAHRWRFAKVVSPLAERWLFDSALGIGACGDWCAGGRVEDAFLSGWELAAAIVAGQPGEAR